jgi:hypothetical protein
MERRWENDDQGEFIQQAVYQARGRPAKVIIGQPSSSWFVLVLYPARSPSTALLTPTRRDHLLRVRLGTQDHQPPPC